MFSKNVDDLTYNDIDDLVNVRNKREGHYLDYKLTCGNLDSDEAKHELAKDVSAFANAKGGYLIIGVNEIKKDDDKTFKIVGTSKMYKNQAVDDWISRVFSL